MDSPFLSIITINYNNADGLRRTMGSVKSQSSKNYEHIIIDGGSTDKSVSVIKEFLSDSDYAKQVTFWCSEKDRGIYDAMNKGTLHANGRFCLYLNSGDYLADNNVVERFSDYDLPPDQIIYTNAIFFNSKKEWKENPPSVIKASIFFEKSPLNHQNILFPLNFIKENPYSLEYKICSDFELCLKAFFKNKLNFKYIDDVISKYENETGISSSEETKQLRSEEWNAQLRKYIPSQFWDDMTELEVYEKKYHGILRKIKNLLNKYSKIKAIFFQSFQKHFFMILS
ncbi:MAG: glycosyltransferase [Treponema sp.]|uniref:glycosyltransferase family 2 protein n=1 Tax=Treponema sp. TaxID=166 RepID=UPI0025D40D57|nr:glycosyltransferase family 2 protein [Treponema sp.]MBQ8679084.1 glycosyltransferase [Treponema sp.]